MNCHDSIQSIINVVEVPITLATEIASRFLYRESDYIHNQGVLENIIGFMYMMETKIIIFNNSNIQMWK